MLLVAVHCALYIAVRVLRTVLGLAEAGLPEPVRFIDATLARCRPQPSVGDGGSDMITRDHPVQISDPPGVALAASYSHVSHAGDFVHVAGQIAKDETGGWVGIGDAGAQARQVYINIGRCLACVGATARDVVKINTILVDRADRDAVTFVRLAFFGDHRPPHSGIIASLGSPEVRVEVEVIAYVPAERRR